MVFVLVRSWGRDERRVELFAAIRFDWQRNQMPIRALARQYDVHRRTVRPAIASALPPERKVPERAAPYGGRWWGGSMDAAGDLTAPRKQRRRRRGPRAAGRRARRRVPYSDVAIRHAPQADITAEARGQGGTSGRVPPQSREPGAEAKVDFGDVTVELAGRRSGATCSRSGCRLRARPATGSTRARRRKRSWKGTWPRSR